MEDGLSALGYGAADVDQLVEGALPQDRVNKLAPRYRSLFDNSLDMSHCIGLPTPPTRYPLKEDLHDIYTNAMTVY